VSRSRSVAIRAICILATVGLMTAFLMPNRTLAEPVLGVSKTVSNVSTGGAPGPTATATPGQTLQYYITYSNTGTVAATPLTITDTVQAGQTFNGVCSAPGATCMYAAPTLTITVPTLVPGGSGTATFQTMVNAGFSGTIANTATATAPGAATATSAATAVTVGAGGTGASILSLTKAVADVTRGGAPASSIFAAPGDQVQYQLTVTNTSTTTAATGVTITDTIQGFQNIATTGFTCGPTTVSCSLNGNVVTFNVGTLAPGASMTVAFNVYVNRSTVNAQQIYDQGTACATNATCVNSNITAIEVSGAGTQPVVVTPPCGCTSPIVVPPYYSPCAQPVYSPCTQPIYSPCSQPVYSPCSQPVYSPCQVTYSPCSQYPSNVVCGNVTAYNPAGTTTMGTVVMNGTNYQIVAGTSFNGTVVAPGYASCFLLNSSAYVTGCLSAIPVAAVAAESAWRFYRLGRMEAY